MKPIFFCKDVITYFAMQFVNELNFRIILIRSMALTMMARRNKKILSWWWKYWINSFLVPDPPTSPQLISDPTSTSVFSGERVKLTCVSGRGNPLPKLTWMRDGNPLRQETGTEYSPSSALPSSGKAPSSGQNPASQPFLPSAGMPESGQSSSCSLCCWDN